MNMKDGTPSKAIQIIIEATHLPSLIIINKREYPVTPFVRCPVQCYKYFRYGHQKKRLQSKGKSLPHLWENWSHPTTMHCNNTQMLQLPRGALLRLPRVPCTKGENPCEQDQVKNVHASCSCLQGSQDHPPPKGDRAGAPARTGVEDHLPTQQLRRRRPRSTPHPQTEEDPPHRQ
ncbi:hypothetical protein ACOMHN_020254 [Nucella lapillus]